MKFCWNSSHEFSSASTRSPVESVRLARAHLRKIRLHRVRLRKTHLPSFRLPRTIIDLPFRRLILSIPLRTAATQATYRIPTRTSKWFVHKKKDKSDILQLTKHLPEHLSGSFDHSAFTHSCFSLYSFVCLISSLIRFDHWNASWSQLFIPVWIPRILVSNPVSTFFFLIFVNLNKTKNQPVKMRSHALVSVFILFAVLISTGHSSPVPQDSQPEAGT